MRKPVTCLAAVLVMSLFTSRLLADEITIDITVSPNVINIASQSTVVTVHTNIAYGLVDGVTVMLNDVAIDWWKSDDRGNFVAKFNAADVKNIVTPGETAELTLTGKTKEEFGGDTFTGTDFVKIVSVKGK